MRPVLLLVVSVLFLGCISLGGQAINGNATQPEENISANLSQDDSENVSVQIQPEPLPRYTAKGFSFSHPPNMTVEDSPGFFSATSTISGTTAELVIVLYENTKTAYGENADNIFKENPTKAASDFLIADIDDDHAGILHKADSIGEITTFSVSRDAYAAQVPFTIKFDGFSTPYTGYALSLYIPERSMHANVRILALAPAKAKSIKDDFLVSFRVE